ncbi:MAG: phospho-sugar mutase [Oscillospiraceae bacterium]|nr:phospho-sugar mutase [Oscillospiraceae bacterium]
MTVNELKKLWEGFDEETGKELSAITDEKEIEDRFYKELEFGTGGLRGVMGAGLNRMNKYTVARATKGYADYLNSVFSGEISVAVAYDSRNNSRFFAETAAGVLAENGIKTFVFNTLMPTPVLSFTVRHLNCNGGIVITASHNPKEYNGYKIYDDRGCQLVPHLALAVTEKINKITDYKSVKIKAFDDCVKDGDTEIIGDEVLDAFLNEVRKQSLYEKPSELKIVYTPLHGTGNIPVRKILEGMNVSVVKEQEMPDGNFSTVRSPNPEEKDALSIGIEQAKRENADLVLGTDPDCDRVGTAVLHKGEYISLTGNQMGALLVNFVLFQKKNTLKSNSVIVKTIVTGELGAKIAEDYSLCVVETLTGFKYIGEKINKYEDSGEKDYVIGYEESYGYLVGTHARDKDAVVSSMLICQMASYYKNQGKTLVDALNEIYEKYGFYADALDTFVLKGKDGAEKIKKITHTLREKGASLFDGTEKVEEFIDYSVGVADLPKENVLKYVFEGGSWSAVRPSGTEPKLKVYYSVCGKDRTEAENRLKKIQSVLKGEIED